MANELLNAPAAESVRLIEFDEARVVPGIVPRTWVLVVTGTKPYVNMNVELKPRMYARRPEFWGIEVVASLPGFGLPMTAPYAVALPLEGITGTKGVEVIGSKRSQKLPVPPKATGSKKGGGTKKGSAKKKK